MVLHIPAIVEVDQKRRAARGVGRRLFGVGTEFAAELKKCQAEIASGNAKGGAELTFLFVENETSLHKAAQAAKQLKGAAGLWIVYPKGNKEITEVRVIDAGRKLGLKDVKVVGFSLTHTALKFVVPLEKR